jgi:pyruvate ferredoxin oxidoreductase gamma subunit
MLEVSLLGRGGQGAFTAARLLGLSAVIHGGTEALAFPSFGPERRGAPVWAYVRISERPVRDRSRITRPDWLVVLDESLLGQALGGLPPGRTRVAANVRGGGGWAELPGGPGSVPVYRLDAAPMAREILGAPRVNTLMLGLLAGLSGCVAREALLAGAAQEFEGKSASRNAAAIEASFRIGSAAREKGYEHAAD